MLVSQVMVKIEIDKNSKIDMVEIHKEFHDFEVEGKRTLYLVREGSKIPHWKNKIIKVSRDRKCRLITCELAIPNSERVGYAYNLFMNMVYEVMNVEVDKYFEEGRVTEVEYEKLKRALECPYPKTEEEMMLRY